MKTVLSSAWKFCVAAIASVGAGLGWIGLVLLSFFIATLLWVVVCLSAVALTLAVGSPVSIPGIVSLGEAGVLPEASLGQLQVDPHPVGLPLVILLTAAALIVIGRPNRGRGDTDGGGAGGRDNVAPQAA